MAGGFKLCWRAGGEGAQGGGWTHVDLCPAFRGAILKREGQETGEGRIVYDPLVIDLEAHSVRLKGKEVGLTSTEFKLLETVRGLGYRFRPAGFEFPE